MNYLAASRAVSAALQKVFIRPKLHAPPALKLLQDSPYFYSSRCTKGRVLTAEPELSGAEENKRRAITVRLLFLFTIL